jgi:hypothetical protein
MHTEMTSRQPASQPVLRSDRTSARLLRKYVPRREDQLDKARDEPIVCAACGQRVTREQDRLVVNGAHEHAFTNPHGIHYRIGCFRDAPGCSELGPATDEWTWFSGYRWRVAVCTSCGMHLGWTYHSLSDLDRFFGLILARLRTASW